MVRLASLLLLCTLAADAQPDFPFRDFSSTAGLRLAGSAQRVRKVLRLTAAERHLAGAIWFEQKQTVSAGFDTAFQFQLTGQGGLGPGADGFAFVIQNSGPEAVGGPGSAGGFALADPSHYGKRSGIPQSVAVFFDTIRNRETHDPSGNYIAICTAGTPKDMRWPPSRLAYTRKLPISLKDGEVHSVRILFQPPIISVHLDGAEVLTSVVELATVVDAQGAAYLGFTASTGNGFENHDILNWSFTRPDVSSNLYVVSSEISFLKTACLPNRKLCTPNQALVEVTGPGAYHIVLPANLEWGASIPNPSSRTVSIQNARGIACWDWQGLGPEGCNGPAGNQSGAGALIFDRTKDRRTWFSIDDRTGNFRDNEGFFEFDVRLQ
jgi:hypothetical protein